jgi:hypothetical protein
VHALTVAARQAPMPSHERADDSIVPLQVASPQAVPIA